MTPEEKAKSLIFKFGTVSAAKMCVDEILTDLFESLEVAKELNNQAEGLIGGSIVIWKAVAKELTL